MPYCFHLGSDSCVVLKKCAFCDERFLFFLLARCRDMPYCSGYDTWSKRTGLCTVKRKRHCYLRNDRLKHAPESSFFLWEIFPDDKQSKVSYSLAACLLFHPYVFNVFCYCYELKRHLTTFYLLLFHKELSIFLNKKSVFVTIIYMNSIIKITLCRLEFRSYYDSL